MPEIPPAVKPAGRDNNLYLSYERHVFFLAGCNILCKYSRSGGSRSKTGSVFPASSFEEQQEITTQEEVLSAGRG